jgi:hypothetical protein
MYSKDMKKNEYMFFSNFGIQFKRKFRRASRIRVGSEKSKRANENNKKNRFGVWLAPAM